MKKFAAFLCSVFLACGAISADAATVTRLTWADRSEETPPFVRIVMDLSEPVTGEAFLSNDGLAVNVLLQSSVIGSGVPGRIAVSSKAVNAISFSRSGDNLVLSAKLNHTIDPSRVKIFPLEADAETGRPQRLVLDIPSVK